MKFCDERIQKHLLNGGKIKRNDNELWSAITANLTLLKLRGRLC